MRKSAVIMISFLCISFAAWSQATPPSKAEPAKKAAGSGEPTAIIDTTAGKLTCKLFEKQTPETVANFIGLANGTKEWQNPISRAYKHGVPLYDGTILHRVIPNFMIQGGDPAGNGSGDPGYKFRDETVPTLTFDRPGRLAMANSGPNTNGSQFFITKVQLPHLDGSNNIVGQSDDSSMNLMMKIARRSADPNYYMPSPSQKLNGIP